jgi:peptide/nickel transport system ATP-binding protein
MSIMLITHDLGVVAENADTVAVMYASRVVETATVEDLFDSPKHPYTEGLFRSIPKLGGDVDRLATIPGTVPNPARFPAGCKFHPRCHRMQGDPKCSSLEPALKEVSPKRWASCHHVDGYESAPVTIPSLSHKRKVVVGASETAAAQEVRS